MIIFPKPYTVRLFSSSIHRGAESTAYKDVKVLADIQKAATVQSVQPEGARTSWTLKGWSDVRFQITDQVTGTLADWIWKDGHWFSCTSCQLSENTLLKHYVSEFELVSEASPSQDTSPPEEEKHESI